MNYKETKAAVTTITYDKDIIEAQTENIYEAISIISKRAVQINTDLKKELVEKLEEFATRLKFLSFMKNYQSLLPLLLKNG